MSRSRRLRSNALLLLLYSTQIGLSRSRSSLALRIGDPDMLSTITKRRALPALRLAQGPTHIVSRRLYHVENRVGNNFPFVRIRSSLNLLASRATLIVSQPTQAYDGPFKTRFTIAYWGLLGGVGFLGVPGLALWLQMVRRF